MHLRDILFLLWHHVFCRLPPTDKTFIQTTITLHHHYICDYAKTIQRFIQNNPMIYT